MLPSSLVTGSMTLASTFNVMSSEEQVEVSSKFKFVVYPRAFLAHNAQFLYTLAFFTFS